ncbi:hypothetical protein CPB83DRAFT_862749 [Crepidotus variabilis]|uniref:F-box domain-containing protein n=1 Tax=Crepidotus variabilis TaxID=179855 RepID=A0A9P6JJP1_9AGAR|nr:hypothetical protein CPB83DRAFT_862749 [Crepidotus variabilis]
MAKSKKKRQQSSLLKDIAPVTPLPPELLWDIFHLVKSDRSSTSSSFETPRFETLFAPELQWIPEVTHICRHWRATALADPSLWAEICVSASNKWATEFLARSKESRTIRITSDMAVEAVVSGSADARRKANFKLCRTVLKKYINRLEAVRFTGVDIAQMRGLLTVGHADEVVQGMKEFAISGPSDHQYDPFLIATDEETLFIFNPAILSRLEIQYCILDWDALKRFHNLTYLRLQFASSWETNISPLDLQEVLDIMPQLKELNVGIEGIVQPAPNVQNDTKKVLVLPDLSFVKLYHPEIGWIRQVLQSIASLNDREASGCRKCVWDIGSADSSDESWDNGGLLSTLSQHVISANNIYSLQMHFVDEESEYERRQGVIFSIWPFEAANRDHMFSLPQVRYEAIVEGFLHRGPFGMRSLTAFKLFCNSGAHETLEEIEISGETLLPDPEELADTLGRLARLRKVTLKMKDWRAELGSFFIALIFDDGTHGVPFAALESIYVKESLSIDVQTERDILEGLQNRYLRGFPISHLELPLEHPKAGYVRDVDALKKIVGTVVVINQ